MLLGAGAAISKIPTISRSNAMIRLVGELYKSRQGTGTGKTKRGGRKRVVSLGAGCQYQQEEPGWNKFLFLTKSFHGVGLYEDRNSFETSDIPP